MEEELTLNKIIGPVKNIRTIITKCRMYYYIDDKYIVRIEPITYSLQTIFNFKITFESVKINNISLALLSNFGYKDIDKISSFIKYTLIYLVNKNSEFYKYYESINKKDVLERIKVINEKIKGDVIDAVIVLIMFTEIKYIFTMLQNKENYIIMSWRDKQIPKIIERIKQINTQMIEKIIIFLKLFNEKVQKIKKEITYFSLQLEPYKKTDENTTLKRIDKKMNYKLIKETPEFYKKYIKPYLISKNGPLYIQIIYEQILQFMKYFEKELDNNIENLTEDKCKKYNFKIEQNEDLEKKIEKQIEKQKNSNELNKIVDINGEYNEFKMALKNVKKKDKIYLFVSKDRNFVGIPVFYQMASYLCGYNDKNIVYLIFCMREKNKILSIRDFKEDDINMFNDLKKEMIAFLIDRFDLIDDKDLYNLEFGMIHPPMHNKPFFYVNVSPHDRSNPFFRRLFINPIDDIIWFLNYKKEENKLGKNIPEPTYVYYLEEDKIKNIKKYITDKENNFDYFIGVEKFIKSFDNYNKEEKKGIQPSMPQLMTGGNKYSTKFIHCDQYFVVPPISKTDGNVEAIIDINFHNNPFSYEEISEIPLQILFTSGQSSFVATIKNDKLNKLIDFEPKKSIISDAAKQLYQINYCPVNKENEEIVYRYLEYPIPKFALNNQCNLLENNVDDNFVILLNPYYPTPKKSSDRVKFLWWWKHKFYEKLEIFLCDIKDKIYDCYDIILFKQQKKYNLGNRLIKGLEEETEKYNVLNKKYKELEIIYLENYNNLIKIIIDEILKNNYIYMIKLNEIYTEYYNNLEEILPKLKYFKDKAALNEKNNIASIYEAMWQKVKERKEKIKESYNRINNLKEKKEKEEIDRTQLENDIKIIYTEVLPSFEDLMDKHPHIKPGFRHSIIFLTEKDTKWLIKLVKEIFKYLEKYGFKSINKNLVDLFCNYPNNVIFSCLHGHILINKDNSYNYEDIPTLSLGRIYNLYTIINMLNLYDKYYLKIKMLKTHQCNTLVTT